ncbi:phosphoribosyl-AMP cyclohydrolase [Candidatus Daviesbacteria bacterium]|nr:phosphoribosyl-AMP cyclohydrolase [Candidatus Daviesbacteria bacterium]
MRFTDIDFEKGQGLVPVVIQDYKTGDVLMLGYMNDEALQKTLDTGLVYFWSRTRKKLWLKGEESGNKLHVKEIFKDCDNDTILIKIALIGKNVCHTGRKSCFFQQIKKEDL